MTKIKKPSKKVLLGVLAVVILLGAAAYFYNRENNKNSSGQDTDSPSSQETINFDPPTEEDKRRVDENKQRITEQEQERIKNQQASGGTTLRSVTPLINFAEQNGENIEIGSYVPGIFENDGICTVTVTKGTNVVTKDVAGVKEGNATFCPLFVINKNEFPETGTWSAVVSYKSPAFEGKSASVKFDIN